MTINKSAERVSAMDEFEPLLSVLTRQCVFGEQAGGDIFGREPLEIARTVCNRSRKHGEIDLYVDGKGRWAALPTSVVYATRLPDNWLVGRYNSLASPVRIMEDLEMRIVEVRAANG